MALSIGWIHLLHRGAGHVCVYGQIKLQVLSLSLLLSPCLLSSPPHCHLLCLLFSPRSSRSVPLCLLAPPQPLAPHHLLSFCHFVSTPLASAGCRSSRSDRKWRRQSDNWKFALCSVWKGLALKRFYLSVDWVEQAFGFGMIKLNDKSSLKDFNTHG